MPPLLVHPPQAGQAAAGMSVRSLACSIVAVVMVAFPVALWIELTQSYHVPGRSQAGVKRFPLGDFRKRGGNIEVKLVPVVGLSLLFARNHRPDRRNGLAKVGIADRTVGVIPEIAGRSQQLH